MYKVLLYYPRISGSEDTSDLYIGAPLSVMAIAAQIDRAEFDVKIVDGRFYEETKVEIDEWISDDILITGISAITSYQITDGIQLAKRLKKRYPNMHVVWGGWHPSLMPDTTVVNDMVDIIIIGQGERIFPELIKCLQNNRDISQIPNLVYKDKDKNIQKTIRKPIEPITSFKSIINSYSLLDMNQYVNK
ncbi:hypothetical protein CG709_19050, partial [Lachnotalea glycerini]